MPEQCGVGDPVQRGAQRPREESAAPVECRREALGREARRKDEPQGRQRDAVAPGVAGRTAHPHGPRIEPLAPGQRHAREHEEQQQVHRELEHGLMGQSRGEIFEKNMPLQRHPAEAHVGDRLDPPHGDQQEPAERQAHVHVSQQRIDPEYAPVEQRLAHRLADGLQRRERRNPLQDAPAVVGRQTPEPAPPLPRHGGEHEQRPDDERYAEWCEKRHMLAMDAPPADGTRVKNPPVYVL